MLNGERDSEVVVAEEQPVALDWDCVNLAIHNLSSLMTTTSSSVRDHQPTHAQDLVSISVDYYYVCVFNHPNLTFDGAVSLIPRFCASF